MRLGMRVLSWCVCSALLMGAGCDSCTESTEAGEGHLEFDVRLRNGDTSTNIHMFALDEDFPCCQLTPISHRYVSLSGISPGESLTFAVGRNGSILKTVECIANDDDANKLVEWIPTNPGANTGTLRCDGW